MISPESRPRLAAKARLRFDPRTDRYMLLYPERGLELNTTAAEIVKMCTGEHTVRAIVSHLTATHADVEADVIEREVLEFLDGIAARGLVGDVV